jgi:hypothetical protein
MTADRYILNYKHDGVIREFAKYCNIPIRDAFDAYYNSTLYKEVSGGVADMHCRSDGYLAEELFLERQGAGGERSPG